MGDAGIIPNSSRTGPADIHHGLDVSNTTVSWHGRQRHRPGATQPPRRDFIWHGNTLGASHTGHAMRTGARGTRTRHCWPDFARAIRSLAPPI